jgi:hypothetical protein
MEMKKYSALIPASLAGAILVGKLLNAIWFHNSSFNDILNILMFSAIGVVYVIVGFAWNTQWIKIAFWACGAYLVLMNFMIDFKLKSIIGIISILVPMLIARFSSETSSAKSE